MSDRLRLAFERASKLSEQEQDAFAAFLLAELADEEEWQTRFAASGDALKKLADSARQEHREGKTRPLDELLS